MKNNTVSINGYGDNLTINNIKIGDLSPEDHENIEKKQRMSILSTNNRFFDSLRYGSWRPLDVIQAMSEDVQTFSTNGVGSL